MQTTPDAGLRALASLSDAARKLLFSRSMQYTLARGVHLLTEGQVCRHVYLVEEGYLRSYHNRDGTDINLAFTFENNFATSLKSLRTGEPSTLAIVAAEGCIVREFAGHDLRALYDESPEIESFGRTLLEQLLVEQEEHAALFRLYSPAERYHAVTKRQPHLLQRVSLTQLASYLGVSRETLSRIRRKRS